MIITKVSLTNYPGLYVSTQCLYFSRFRRPNGQETLITTANNVSSGYTLPSTNITFEPWRIFNARFVFRYRLPILPVSKVFAISRYIFIEMPSCCLCIISNNLNYCSYISNTFPISRFGNTTELEFVIDVVFPINVKHNPFSRKCQIFGQQRKFGDHHF